MLSCDDMSGHTNWNEAFHYCDTKLSYELKGKILLIQAKLFRTKYRVAFGIAGPWAWPLDPEMLDSGLRFRKSRPTNTQNLLHPCINFGPVC